MIVIFTLLRSNCLLLNYPFIFQFNEQQILNKNLAKIISLKAALHRCSAKYVFLKVLQNSQENTRVGSLFSIKLQAEKIS